MSPQSTEDSQDKPNSHGKKTENGGAIADSPSSISRDPSSPSKPNNPNGGSNFTWLTWAKFKKFIQNSSQVIKWVAEIVLVGITIKIMFIYSGQLSQMIQANTISQKILTGQARIIEVNQGPPEIGLTPWMGFYSEGDRAWAIAAVRNLGNTGAEGINISALAEFRIQPPSFPDDFRHLKKIELPDKSRDYLIAHQEKWIPFTNDPPTDRRFEQYVISERIYTQSAIGSVDSRARMYIWGHITFTDLKGDTPEVSFCRWMAVGDVKGAGSGGKSSNLDCYAKNTN